MSIINVNKLVWLVGNNDFYTYTRVKNLLAGKKGRSSKKDIQQVRKIIEKEMTTAVNTLLKLENE